MEPPVACLVLLVHNLYQGSLLSRSSQGSVVQVAKAKEDVIWVQLGSYVDNEDPYTV